jgi:hypothetical protein
VNTRALVCIGLSGFLASCAPTQQRTVPSAPAVMGATPAPTQARRVLIFLPQTDQSAGALLKSFEKYPSLRMVIAVSPRFQRFNKEPALKEAFLALHKAGHLEFALQLPNSPFLPLLINTDAATAATPPGTPLPSPAYAYPDDVIQVIAKAKADFSRTWGFAPTGLVLPNGAANADLMRLIGRLGWKWVVGAFGLPNNGQVYQTGSVSIWDATPLKENNALMIHVIDERGATDSNQALHMVQTWSESAAKATNSTIILPMDPDLPTADLPKDLAWGNRTWATRDWTPWIGTPSKNAAWTWLRTTREALERYKDSGRASVRRLDMAFEEIFNAENANFFLGIADPTTSAQAEARQREFQATLSSVFRLIGQDPPENLFSTEVVTATSDNRGLSSVTTATWQPLAGGQGRLLIEDPAGDDKGDGQLLPPSGTQSASGTYDLRRLEVVSDPDTLQWTLTLGGISGAKLGNSQTGGPLVDIYIDLNGASSVGTTTFLPNRGAAVAAADAWEYAIVLWRSEAQFYRTRGTETYEMTDTVPITVENNQVRFSLPRDWMRGNPQRWGYQTLVMAYDQTSPEKSPRPALSPEMAAAKRLPIFDVIDPSEMTQTQLLTQVEEGRRTDIPFIRTSASR